MGGGTCGDVAGTCFGTAWPVGDVFWHGVTCRGTCLDVVDEADKDGGNREGDAHLVCVCVCVCARVCMD